MYPSPTLLHTLRRNRALAGAAVSWCMLALAVAVLAPLWSTGPATSDLHQVCSAVGTPGANPAQRNASDAPTGSQLAGGWHCVLCLGGAAPLEAPVLPMLAHSGNSAPIWASDTPAAYSRHAGPAPARGPPAA